MRHTQRKSRRRLKGGGKRTNESKEIQESQESQETNTEPVATLASNASKAVSIAAQVANNVTASMLDWAQEGVSSAEAAVGIDPAATVQEKMKEVGDVAEALRSPEGQQALANVGSVLGEVGEKVVGPALGKTGEVVSRHAGDISKNVVNAGMDALASTPLAPLIELPRLAADLGNIAEKTTSMVSELVNVGQDSLHQAQEQSGQVQRALADLQQSVAHANQWASQQLDRVAPQQQQSPHHGGRKKNTSSSSSASASELFERIQSSLHAFLKK